MESEITSVSANGRILKNPYMEELNDVDQALTYVEFESGAAGDMEASRNSPYGYDVRTEIIGTEGSLVIGTLRNQYVTQLNTKGSNYEMIPNFQSRFKDSYLLEMVHFIECLKNNVKPSVTEIDAKFALEIALAATESFRNGKSVNLDKMFNF